MVRLSATSPGTRWRAGRNPAASELGVLVGSAGPPTRPGGAGHVLL
ncbi:hypothetical protein [Parafrankia elaeagni]|nr:hypothetical protein [Parafrankia elaeagni]